MMKLLKKHSRKFLFIFFCLNFINLKSIFSRPTTLAVNKFQDSEFNSKSNYTTTIKETNERYVTRQDGEYGCSTSFRPIDKNATGARAIRVQDIPNGVIGRPVEFESKFFFYY